LPANLFSPAQSLVHHRFHRGGWINQDGTLRPWQALQESWVADPNDHLCQRMKKDVERTQLGEYGSVAEKAAGRFRIVESGRRKMKPRLSSAFALVLAILAI